MAKTKGNRDESAPVLIVELPDAVDVSSCYGTTVSARVTARHVRALKMLTAGLDQANARTSDGAPVYKNRSRALVWLLDRLAEAYDVAQ